MTLPIPPAVLYAGLAGVLLSLVVATATNGWQLRVFALLALRLAVGWLFLFAGLEKVYSFAVGPTDSNRVFTSEPYFAAAEGPLGEYMRKKYLGDPEATYKARLTKKEPRSAADFKQLTPEGKAEVCPDAAAELLTGEDAAKSTAAKAKFAAWVYGAEARDAKVSMVTGDIPLTAEQRLSALDLLQRESDALTARDAEGLGRGYGYEIERKKKLKGELLKAQADLAADTDKFLAELRTEAGFPPLDAAEKPIKSLDRLTAYTITAVGAGLLLGLFTKLWCLVGVGFLVMTYLAHPTVPWLSLPPNTEGKPLFINNNLIIALALLVVFVHPTGRWLGLDALLCRLIFGPEKAAAPTAVV